MKSTRLERLLELLEENPVDAFSRFALAKEYERAGKKDEALNSYRDLLDMDPGYLGTYYHFGKLLESLGLDNQALDIYRLGIKKSGEVNDRHTLSELQNAYQNLLLELDEA